MSKTYRKNGDGYKLLKEAKKKKNNQRNAEKFERNRERNDND